jgi:hypothetical protein
MRLFCAVSLCEKACCLNSGKSEWRGNLVPLTVISLVVVATKVFEKIRLFAFSRLSASLSVCPQVKAAEPLDRVPWHLILQSEIKIYRNTRLKALSKNCESAMGTPRHSLLRQCATSGNVAGSIPDGVIGIFYWHNPAGHTLALGSTQPLTEMSTRIIAWGKNDRCVGLTTLLTSYADCLEILGILTYWNPKGLSGNCFTFLNLGICLLSFFFKRY